ncbi:hypothetical protein CG709_09040 [Lachnotalea glycerini]|nr:hypothetical protein CG709_09040 [Lachnotalea glycerini]
MGRTLQKSRGDKSQGAIFMPILEGLDGIEKMSKSLGNYIGVNESAEVMFKKVMEIPDCLIIKYFELATAEHPERILVFKKKLEDGFNPKEIKLQLALTITGLYFEDRETQKAYDYYHAAFETKAIPDNIPKLVIEYQKDMLSDVIGLLVENNYVSSSSEFRRLIIQGGISINGEKISDLNIVMACGDVIRIGKKKFVKIVK